MKITIKQILTAAAVEIGAVALVRFVKHEAKEMKKEKEDEAAETETATETASFTADEATYMNYVDEGFMGFTANDEFMMLGGGKPIEFSDFKGNRIPIATDEPNFAYGDGTHSEVMTTSPLIDATTSGGGTKGISSGGKGRRIRHITPRTKKEPLDIEDIWKSGKKYRNPIIQQAPQEKVRVGKRGTITPKGVVLPPRRGKAIKAETDTMSSKGIK